MDQAFIDGAPAELAAATAVAARLLGNSRQPVIAGLGADVAGTRAAISLASRIGASVDHMHGDALLRNLDAMREAGAIVVAPTEARVRADTVLLVGPGAGATEHPVTQYILGTAAGGVAERRVVWLCPGADAAPGDGTTVVGADAAVLPGVLAALRARVGGRPAGAAAVSAQTLDDVAAALKAARFGVAVWSAQALDALTIAMLYGLIDDLNAATRFSGLPLPPPDNAVGVETVCGWMTGFPVRTVCRPEAAEHDPWRYHAARMVESGETDCVLWISAFAAVAPPWRRQPPALVALAPRDAAFATPPQVHIAVGAPGRDHDGVCHHAMLGSLAAVPAAAPGAALAVEAALAAITAQLSAGER